ncbi:hypothetical protein F2Q70_00040461 [Brassica cretica]|uniref:Uncharacterized protein n=1 Tax=Brassica cretica TaxID=69181 RepID=A0A8S9K4X7_BRACR|nr:hypothetical protein F2Q70_00040461 [Brassica cretica]
MNKRQNKKMKEHFDMIGYVTDAHYGIPSRCPCGERVIDEFSQKPKYPTYFDTFSGSRYFTCKDFEEVQRLRERMNMMADEIAEYKEFVYRLK